MSDTFKDRFYNLNASAPLGYNNLKEVLEIQCMPLQYILQRLGMLRIDFLSLDVEGGELEVRLMLCACHVPCPAQPSASQRRQLCITADAVICMPWCPGPPNP